MTVSGKELPEVLAELRHHRQQGRYLADDRQRPGDGFITLDNFQPDPNVQNMMPATLVRLHGALPCGTARKACTSAWWTP